MDIDSARQENASKTFLNLTSGAFELDKLDISLSYIDFDQKCILSVTTNYPWHLKYWENNLDTQLTQRLLPGIVNWKKYDQNHQSTFKNCMPSRKSKIDICTQHNNLYELMSISTNSDLDFSEMGNLLMSKPKISALARKSLSKQNTSKLALPLRCIAANNNPSVPLPYLSSPQMNTWQFGKLTMTNLEMDTIRQLIMCRAIKEIAKNHRCSEKVERNRLENIKRKMDCEYRPLSCLFDKLKQNGILQSCLDSYIIYP